MNRHGVELHLLRHADAGDAAAWRGDDAARPLSARGTRQAERLARHLSAAGFAPDVILSSPLARARQTADIVATELGIPVREAAALARSFGTAELETTLAASGHPRRPLLVGHDPDFSDLVAALVGAGVPVRKGALVRIDLDLPVRRGGGTLRWLLPPDLLGDGA